MATKTKAVYAALSPAPKGYLQWHQWAQDQYQKHKLRQQRCGRCSRWWFPQELSDRLDVVDVEKNGIVVTRLSVVCLECFHKRKSR